MNRLDYFSPEKAQRVLLWHWGKEGAGAKFTMALGSALANHNRAVHVSAARESDLARDPHDQTEITSTTVSIFNGD